MIRGIILASGQGVRMGLQKLLLPLRNHTVIEEVIKNSKESSLDEILLVYSEPRDIFMDICKKHDIHGIYNESYSMGQSRSIIKGIENSENVEGFLFLLGDQPFADSNVIDTIIKGHRENPGKIIAPVYDGRRGNPVLFPSLFKKELLALSGDTGGREVINRNPGIVKEVEITSLHAFLDIDIISDYKIAKEIMRNEHF